MFCSGGEEAVGHRRSARGTLCASSAQHLRLARSAGEWRPIQTHPLAFKIRSVETLVARLVCWSRYALVDGHMEKVGNTMAEPPGLFRGRGKHPLMGKAKQRIMPEQVRRAALRAALRGHGSAEGWAFATKSHHIALMVSLALVDGCWWGGGGEEEEERGGGILINLP